jgi:tetratricopeptide (TPR) repeat protein
LLGQNIVVEADNAFADLVEGERLFKLLDGLPLAIAQAGAYLHESGTGLRTYLKFYEQQWKELMESRELADVPLQDYDYSVWTTWAISYTAVREKHKATANLLLLWSFLDNGDLWHGLFAAACRASTVAARSLLEWIGDMASNKLEFVNAMRLLRNYSLIEDVPGVESYVTHPVVHKWAYHYQGKHFESKLARLAVVVVGWAVPHATRDSSAIQRRLLPHAQVCSQWVLVSAGETGRRPRSHNGGVDFDESEEREGILGAIHGLGLLYADQAKLAEAETMYQRALTGYEKALGPEHTLTLSTVGNLGLLYANQSKLAEAETMYQRALTGKEKALGLEHISTLSTVGNLSNLYKNQNKLAEAETMYQRALQGFEKALGVDNATTYIPALNAIWGLGSLFERQADLAKARIMYSKALVGYEKVVGRDHSRSQRLRDKLRALDTVTENKASNTHEREPGEQILRKKRRI